MEKERLTENYRVLLGKADAVITNCQPLVDEMAAFYPEIELIPNGCDFNIDDVEIDRRIEARKKLPESGRQSITYIGNLEKKLDVALLEKIAKEFPDVILRLIGSSHMNKEILSLRKCPNVLFQGVVPYREIRNYLLESTVGIIPHIKSDLSKKMNPLKLYVYLAHFVPVVTTEIENVDVSSSMVFLSPTHEDFLHNVKNILNGRNIDYASAINYLRCNSWQKRFGAFVDGLVRNDRGKISRKV
jgi:hypothetical protein